MTAVPPTYTNSFYITLPSNVSSHYFKSNKASEYTVKLAQPIQLRGKWEVGLAEIQYPHTWNTFNVPLMATLKPDPDIDDEYTIIVKAGFYSDINSLIETIIGETPLDHRDRYHWRYNKNTCRVSLTLRDGASMQFVGHELPMLLGFDRYKQYGLYGGGTVSMEHTAVNPPNMQLGVYSLFVYSSIIAPVPVGDVAVPLLRIIPVEGVNGEMVTKTYDKPHYAELNTNNFDTIETHISSDTGKIFNFKTGKVTIKLHFRPRGLQFY